MSKPLKDIYFVFFRSLDLSFNLIKVIENLGCLTKLKKLYLVQNKVSKVEGLQNFSQLEMLELGANKIRVSTTVSCDSVYSLTVGCYTSLLRRAQNISWRDRAVLERIYGGLTPVSLSLKQKLLQFAGHCYRADEEIFSSLILWCPVGRVQSRKLTHPGQSDC